MSEPTLEWTKLSGSDAFDVANSVAIDSNNNVYITGRTPSSLDGETHAGGNDAFLVKYDSAGTKLWTRLLGSELNDIANCVATDSNNNVYITGYTGGSLVDGQPNVGSNDIFLAKYDSAGTKLWTTQLGSTNIDQSVALAIDSNNNAYITGFTTGSLGGETNAGSFDVFLAKYDSAGTFVWTTQLGSTTNDFGLGVAIDSNNNVYITGYTDGILEDGQTNTGSNDVFLAKYDSAGTKVWIKLIGSSANDQGQGVAIDSNNYVYIAGNTGGILQDGGTNAGVQDVFLAKYDSDGTKVWTKQMGSSLQDYMGTLAIDLNNNVYITGYTGGSLVDGQPNAGSNDVFLAKYDSAGTFVWTVQLGSSGNDQAFGVAIDSNNNAYITGNTNGNLDGETNAGGGDIFLAKYSIPPSPPPPLSQEIQTSVESSVPLVDITESVIIVDVAVGVLTTGSEIEKSQKRTLFLEKLFTDNVGLSSAVGKITMSKTELLGSGSSITKSTMVIIKASNTDTSVSTSSLGENEGVYVYMGVGDFAVFDTTVGKLKIKKQTDILYAIYDGYVDSNTPITKTMNVGESSSYGSFTYVVGGVSGQVSTSGGGSVAPICFPSGTPVETDQGEVSIEKLNPDIHSIRGKRIVAITETRPLFSHIVCIEKDALGKRVPCERTEISKEHCVFYKGKMMRAVDLVCECNGVSEIGYNGEPLYNVLLEKHGHMIINNLICETLHPENIMGKICGGKYKKSDERRLCAELSELIRENDVRGYKKLYGSLK